MDSESLPESEEAVREMFERVPQSPVVPEEDPSRQIYGSGGARVNFPEIHVPATANVAPSKGGDSGGSTALALVFSSGILGYMGVKTTGEFSATFS